MAETAVGAVLQNLALLLFEEAKTFGSVKPKIESITNELEMIRPFLRNADERAAREELDNGESDDGIRAWVKQIGEKAYHIEDVIEEYTFSVAQLHHGANMEGVLARFCICTQMLKLRCKIVSDVNVIMSSLKDINERRKRWDLTLIEDGSRNGTIHAEQGSRGADSYFSEVVGHETVIRKLRNWLLRERTQRRVLTLVGAGGLGKTTLVACAYKSDDARNLFDCYAWIDVGRIYNRDDVFRMLLRKFYTSRKEPLEKDVDKMNNKELSESLRSYLDGMRYMIVFDDVWEADFWEHMKYALPNNSKANRIFITTRYKTVGEITADPGDDVRVHMLEKLSLEEAQELFYRKTFPDSICPPDLEELSHKILEKCDGLPLAIVAIGGLLKKKNQVDVEWVEILKSLSSNLERDFYGKDCNRVIWESYNDLPHRLKPCLLYFSLFPDSFTIECERLFRLWIAEGFVQHESHNRSKLNEAAEKYLNELIARSMVQVIETSIDEKALSVRVHEVTHQIIRRKAELIGFSQLLKEMEAEDFSQQRQTRRITLYKSTDKVVETVKDSKVRSVFIFEIDKLPSAFMSELATANFKLVKVLDLQGASLDDSLPEGVGNLFNLRFLSVKNTKVRVLQKSIGQLFNLDTLDLRHTLVSELPNAIRKLKKLRCLLGGQLDEDDHTRLRGMKVKQAIGHLTELQELAFVETDSKVVKELGKLTKLKKLGVRVTPGKRLDISAVISEKKDLQSLEVESMDQKHSSDLQSIDPPQGLRRLCFTGILKSLPNWISNLQNLVQLHLTRSGLLEDPFKVLCGLPNLMELSFIEACNSEYLHFKKDWFLSLKSLVLVGFHELKSMIIDDGAMPILESLHIESSQLLKVPTGIQNLRRLLELILVDMPKEFFDEIANSNPHFKIFISRMVDGRRVIETRNRPVSLEDQQASSSDDEGGSITHGVYNSPKPLHLPDSDSNGSEGKEKIKNNIPLVSPGFQQSHKDEKEGCTFPDGLQHLSMYDKEEEKPDGLQHGSKDDKEEEKDTDKDDNHSLQPQLPEMSKDENKGKQNIENDIPPILVNQVQPELHQARDDSNFAAKQQESKVKKENDVSQEDFGHVVESELQSKDYKEREDAAEEVYSHQLVPEAEKVSEESKKGEYIEDSTPAKQPKIQQNMEKDIPSILVNQVQLELHQAKDDSNFAAKQQESKKKKESDISEEDFGHVVKSELQKTSKDYKEKEDVSEEVYTHPLVSEAQKASEGSEEGNYIVAKDSSPAKQPKIQQNIEKDIPSILVNQVQPEIYQAKDDRSFLGKQEESKKKKENDIKQEEDFGHVVESELQKTSKDYIHPLVPESQKVSEESKEGNYIVAKDSSPAEQPKIQQNMEVWPELHQAKDDSNFKAKQQETKKKENDLSQEDFGHVLKSELQQTSKDYRERDNVAEEVYTHPLLPEAQVSEVSKERKYVVAKESSPPEQTMIQEVSRDDEEDKYVILKDTLETLPDLPKSDKEGKDITEEIYSSLVCNDVQEGEYLMAKSSMPLELQKTTGEDDNEEKEYEGERNLTEKDIPRMQTELLDQNNEDDKYIEKPPTEHVLQTTRTDMDKEKDVTEGKKLIDEDHPPMQPEQTERIKNNEEEKNVEMAPVRQQLQRSSEGHDGKEDVTKGEDRTGMDYPSMQPKLPETTEDENEENERREMANEDVDSTRVEPRVLTQNVDFWKRLANARKEEEAKRKQNSEDSEKRKEVAEKDDNASVEPDRRPPNMEWMKRLLQRPAGGVKDGEGKNVNGKDPNQHALPESQQIANDEERKAPVRRIFIPRSST